MSKILDKLKSSESDLDIKNSTEKIYNEAINILEKLKKENPKKYQKALSEYEQLKEKIISSLEDNNKITKEELLSLKLELDDLKNLNLGFWEKNKDDDFKNKNINDYSEIEAKIALEYLNSNYNNYPDGLTAGFDEDNINELKDKKDVNVFQERLINKIIGNKKGNSKEYFHGYNNEKGNFLLTKEEIEEKLQNSNFQSINTLALKNYFNILDQNQEFEIDKLNDKYGKEKTQEILDFIKRQKEFKSDSFFEKAKKIIEDFISEIIDKITNSSSIDEFKDNLEEINKQDKERQKEILKKLNEQIKNERKKLEELFLKLLKEKGIDEKNANEKAIELIDNIIKNLKKGKLDKAIEIIYEFNKKYETNIDNRQVIKSAIEIAKLKITAENIKNNINIKNNAENERKNIELTEKNIELVKEVLKNISDEQLNDIATGKVKYNEVLKELAEKDYTIKKLLKQIEENKKYSTETEKNNDNGETNLRSKDIKEVNYDEKSGKLSYQIRGEKITLILNPKEQEIIKNKPEIKENIINFYNILDKVGLKKLWNIKEQIFNSIRNKNGIGFSIEGDYLNENEIKIFLNSILKSVGKETIEGVAGIDEFIAIMEIKNNTQISGEEKKVNIHGDTTIERLFINKYSPRGSLHFNTSLFEQNL